MCIFKTKSFSRLADKEGITDPELMAAADEVNRGIYEADLERIDIFISMI
ncbi:hypothetical protein FACS1894110_16680 [Spirochaetia bacterium]|nr:hypothetical protein FACS1894110_16680 [Spirochaetia bacterium]